MYTVEDVARWMSDAVNTDGVLYQYSAVVDIEQQFGKEFVYLNDNGNQAISPKVLAAFRKLTETSVVWEKGEKCWRLRDPHDTSKQRQVE